MRVAVAGGTGLLGRLVVSRLSAEGAEHVVPARAHGVDVTTGKGLEARGRRTLPFPVNQPGAVGRALVEGTLPPAGEARIGHQRFAEWLSDLSGATR